MKKIFVLIVSTVLALGIFSGCSKDGVVLSKYVNGKKEYSVKIGDVKNELLKYVVYDPMIAGNANWHKDYLFDRYIFQDITLFEEAEKGLTNQPDFLARMNSQYQKQYFTRLFQIGQTALNKKAKTNKYDIVRVSHILLTVNKFTNINGTPKELSDADYQKLLSEKENKALNIIDSLKASKNLNSDFSNTALAQSEDGGSSHAGGDVGFFVRGSMVKEFEEASFKATSKGLIDKPVKSTYGYHIVYITVPSQKKNISEIQALMGKDSFKRMEPYIQNNFNETDRKATFKELYAVSLSNNTINIGDKNFTADKIPEDSKLFTIYGKPYTWKESKDIILYFVPMFTNNLTSTNFNDQMENLKNFIHLVEVAKNNKTDKSSAFIKEMANYKDGLYKNLASQEFEKDFVENGRTKITAEAVQNYYNSMKSTLVKSVNGKNVQMSFKEAEGKIREDLLKQMLRESYQDWKEQMKKKYRIVFSDSGFKTMKEIETAQLKEQQKASEKSKKQNTQKKTK